ncbi:MAG TPA: MFS transporter [Stellaceae bacterium]|nr:MFS transporter [Stellaceae bacterium]
MAETGFFRNRWWMVFASVIGLTVNTGVVSVFLFSVFIKPVTEELGLSRGGLSSALVVGSLFTAILTPVFGWAIDRFGIKAVHLPMIAAFALSTASLSLMPASLPWVVVIYTIHNMTGAGQSPVAYSKTLAGWFDKDRGLALGIAIAGVGLGVIIMPQYAGYMITHYGWRAAYVGIGIAILVLAFIPVAVFMRDPPTSRAGQRGSGVAAALEGATWGEAAFRSWRFWAMTIAFFLVVVAVNGTLGSIVAVLTDRGLPLQTALGALSASGAALFAGRILSGYLLDRIHGPYVATLFFCCSIAGIAIIAGGGGGMAPFAGTLLCGLGIGAEVDLMAFFVSRYFGLKSFGAIYGTMFALFSLGNGVGPLLMGITYDHFHNYVPMLIGFDGALAVACLLLLGLGPYRFAARSGERTATA